MFLGAQGGKALAHSDPNHIFSEIVSKHFVLSKHFVVSKHLAVSKHCVVSKTSGGWCEARYTTPTVAHQQEESF